MRYLHDSDGLHGGMCAAQAATRRRRRAEVRQIIAAPAFGHGIKCIQDIATS
jgi:hypothetical protein